MADFRGLATERMLRQIQDDRADRTCEVGGEHMRNEFTALVERDGEWFIAYCPEIPGANGQGRTKEECLQNLADAIELILEDRREDALRGLPEDAEREVVTIG